MLCVPWLFTDPNLLHAALKTLDDAVSEIETALAEASEKEVFEAANNLLVLDALLANTCLSKGFAEKKLNDNLVSCILTTVKQKQTENVAISVFVVSSWNRSFESM